MNKNKSKQKHNSTNKLTHFTTKPLQQSSRPAITLEIPKTHRQTKPGDLECWEQKQIQKLKTMQKSWENVKVFPAKT